MQAIDASGPAAAAATRDYYKDRGVTGKLPARGGLAALTTPGAVDGWRLAHERFGRLPWESLFDDAIEYARNGVGITRSLADWLATDVNILQQDRRMAEVFLPDGRPQREGALLVQA
ncbi:gamma-glutamyltranspeptidase family protein, partial [Brucella grignonensis]